MTCRPHYLTCMRRADRQEVAHSDTPSWSSAERSPQVPSMMSPTMTMKSPAWKRRATGDDSAVAASYIRCNSSRMVHTIRLLVAIQAHLLQPWKLSSAGFYKCACRQVIRFSAALPWWCLCTSCGQAAGGSATAAWRPRAGGRPAATGSAGAAGSPPAGGQPGAAVASASARFRTQLRVKTLVQRSAQHLLMHLKLLSKCWST